MECLKKDIKRTKVPTKDNDINSCTVRALVIGQGQVVFPGVSLLCTLAGQHGFIRQGVQLDTFCWVNSQPTLSNTTHSCYQCTVMHNDYNIMQM